MNSYIMRQKSIFCNKESYWKNFLDFRTRKWKCRITQKFLLSIRLLWESEFLKDLEQA